MEIGIAILIAALCCALSGARSLAYGLYFLSFVPFLSINAVEGGLQAVTGFGGENVRFKLAVRGFCTLGFLLLLARRKETVAVLFQRRCWPILGLLLWSLLWMTRSATPWISLFRLLELFSFLLAGAALYLESGRFHSLRSVLRWHCLALWTLPVVGLLLTVLRPELAVHTNPDELSRLGHKLLNANSLGFASTVVILWATSELRSAWSERRLGAQISPILLYGTWVPLLTSAYVLLVAHSRTAMLTLVIGQCILWWPRPGTRWVSKGALAGVAFIGLGLWQSATIESWLLRGDSVESLSSATGRTPLWSELLREQVPNAPIAGAGYLMLSDQGGYWHAGRMWTNAHNSYLFALVSAGLVGLVLLLQALWLPWIASWRRMRATRFEGASAAPLLFSLLTVILVTSITGFGVFGYPNPAMFLFFSLYALALAPHPAGLSAPVSTPSSSPVLPPKPISAPTHP